MYSPLHFGFRNKLPLFLQTEASECGLACLAMIASFFGQATTLLELRKRFAISLKGATLAELISIAEEIGFTSRPLRLELEDLGQLQLPAILHWNLNHFVILKAVKGNAVYVNDPAIGELKLPLSAVSVHFTGVALELTPDITFSRKVAQPPIRLGDVVGRIVGLKRGLLQILALAIALEALTLLSPMITQWITDEAIVSGDYNLLALLGIGLMSLGVFSAIITAVRSWIGLYISTNFNLQWMSNVMGHLLKLPVDYFERRHLGDIVARFGTVRTIEHTITSATVDSVMDGLLAFSTLAMMFIYSPKLAVVTLCAVVLYGIVRWMRYNSAKLAQTGLLAKTAIEQTYFLETIRGARSIKLNNKENERRTAWMNLLVDSTNASLTTTKLSLFFTTTWGLISTVERTGVLWLGAQSVIQNTMSIGMLFAFLGYKEQFASRINALIDRFVDFRMLSVQTERLADIVLTAPEEPPEQSIYDLPENVALSLKRLNYRYAKGEPWLLHSLNLKIEQGECVAIIGPSGSGKTTLMKLMLGILRPVSGEVCIGEPNPVSLNKIGLRNYRKFVATVMQDDQLFAGSLMENICFLDAKPEVDWMYECAKMAQIHNEIVSMPMGYHTLVGDMGTVLSGGQKQRVLLARALYRRPKILFLDEATSHLDLDNEANITKAIAELQITRIMIAHRPQTIAIADRILTLKNGKIIDIKGDANSIFAATSSSDNREKNTVE